NDCPPNGLPVFTIAVTGVTNGATGTVESIPDGLYLTGAGTATFSFSENDVNFIAEPVGAHARARFTNGCVATGAYGTKAYCKNLTRVILQAPASGPHPITVTYECEPGFTCQNSARRPWITETRSLGVCSESNAAHVVDAHAFFAEAAAVVAAVVDELGLARDLGGVIDRARPAAVLHDHQVGGAILEHAAVHVG